MVLNMPSCIVYSQGCSDGLSYCLCPAWTAHALQTVVETPLLWLMQTACRYLNPVSWGLYGIIVTQMGDLNESLALTDGTSTTVKDYLYDTYHYEYSFRWPVSNPSSHATCAISLWCCQPLAVSACSSIAHLPCRHC